MSLSNELQRLADLKASGALTESEFQQAKEKLLNGSPRPYSDDPGDFTDHSVGRAANRYVTFQMVMAVVGILLFLFFIAPRMCSIGGPSIAPPFGM